MLNYGIIKIILGGEFMIYFVRHGETDYNVKGIAQGQLDIPLNQAGRNDATVLSGVLEDYEFDAIYCSPLVRAKETAEIINKKHDVEIIFDDRLKEFNAGQRQGTTLEEWGEEREKDFMVNPEKYGAESNLEFYTRCAAAYDDIPKDKNVLIVAHGGVYKNIYRHINGIKDLTAKVSLPGNCSVIEVTPNTNAME